MADERIVEVRQGVDVDVEWLIRELEAERERANVNWKSYERVKEAYSQAIAVKNGEVWYWQGDGEDHLESLTCAVVISADKLRRPVETAGWKRP